MTKPVDGAEALAIEILAAEYEATAPAGKYIARDIRSGNLSPENERAIRAMLAHSAALVADARLAGVKEGLEEAWRDGFNCARNCVSEDEAFCLTEDVERDAWLDSATAIRAIPVKADDRERA